MFSLHFESRCGQTVTINHRGLTYKQSIYAGIYNLGICFTTVTIAGTTGAGESSFAPPGIPYGMSTTATTNVRGLPGGANRETVVIGYQSPLTVV